jgi:two-component system chemotaxis response regulator CheB
MKHEASCYPLTLSPIKALVVDDSAFMRKMVGDILRKNGIDVIGTAFDGLDGLEKARVLRPDVITLDVEMPRLDGVGFLRALMEEIPTPVVVLSSHTESGSDITIRCLELGAFEALRKPSGAISLDIERIAADIVEKVRAAAMAGRRAPLAGISAPHLHEDFRPARNTQRMPSATSSRTRRNTCRSEEGAVVVIASSTGGPAALQNIVPYLPGDLAASLVIVQHMPVGFTKALANSLNCVSALHVREAEPGDALCCGAGLVAPGGTHLSFNERGRVMLTSEPPLWGVRPAADVTLRSAAERFGARVISVILTGMGRDGALGAKAVRLRGGVCLAQNEETCVVYGMPCAAYEAGAVNRLLPLNKIASAIEGQVAGKGSREQGKRNTTLHPMPYDE